MTMWVDLERLFAAAPDAGAGAMHALYLVLATALLVCWPFGAAKSQWQWRGQRFAAEHGAPLREGAKGLSRSMPHLESTSTDCRR